MPDFRAASAAAALATARSGSEPVEGRRPAAIIRIVSRRRPRRTEGRAESPPDLGHGCADPACCSRPFCAASVEVHLVPPEETRVVVRELPGWPVSASALLDGLNARIGRQQLLGIAGSDPFGAHLHFPFLVRIRLSGQVPPKLAFDPGEALRLTRSGDGPGIDHLARAWCCTLLTIAPDGSNDDLHTVAGHLTESCLALGGDLPQLAEQLLAWRAVTEDPDIVRQRGEDDGRADPVALLALLLLRAATNPADARLVGLAHTLADTFAAPLPRPWRRLINTILTPLRPAHPDLDRLANALSRANTRHGHSGLRDLH